ncbi:hypothetical protein GCM10022381_41620 [Leifsonia kafniensis]|uniref:Type II secretion system protein n=1 Tax=Leifsonia kafniensis TaxID=475957 RepID=A0ABP7L6B9_9MICO
MTLIELIVAMGVFMIFIAMVLTTIVTLAQSATRAQLTAEASNASLTVFGSFDRQARYADAINTPGTSPTGKRYMEFRTPGNSSASGFTTCTQWRFNPALGRLESRSWKDIVGVSLPPFTTKLTNVIDDGGANYPFKLTLATSAVTMQQLTVTLHSGNAKLNAGALMSSTFVARNSSTASPALVCAPSGYRE